MENVEMREIGICVTQPEFKGTGKDTDVIYGN